MPWRLAQQRYRARLGHQEHSRERKRAESSVIGPRTAAVDANSMAHSRTDRCGPNAHRSEPCRAACRRPQRLRCASRLSRSLCEPPGVRCGLPPTCKAIAGSDDQVTANDRPLHAGGLTTSLTPDCSRPGNARVDYLPLANVGATPSTTAVQRKRASNWSMRLATPGQKRTMRGFSNKQSLETLGDVCFTASWPQV